MIGESTQPRSKAFSLFPIVIAASVLSGAVMAYEGTGANIGAFIEEAAGVSSSSVEYSQASSSADSAAALLSSESSEPSSAGASAGASSAVPDEAPAVVLGTASTSSSSNDENRAKNLAIAADAIDGLRILPGETFSLNDILGNIAASTIYVQAPEDTGAQSTLTQGGGVNQVASTLYVAAVRANLEVIEKHAHDVPVNYAAVGFDAEVAYHEKDLKLRNTGTEPVSIRATANGQTVTVEIRGQQQQDNVSFDLVATVANDDGSAGDPANLENAESPTGGTGDTPTEDGSVTVASYRVTLVNGVKSSEEPLFVDTYRTNSQPFTTEKGFAGGASK